MRFFPGATSLLKGATFIDFWFLKNFLRIFNFLFLWLCIKESNYLLFKRGLRLFKGLCLLFLPNVPGAMFIQGGTFIPDSRVHNVFVKHIIRYPGGLFMYWSWWGNLKWRKACVLIQEEMHQPTWYFIVQSWWFVVERY